jgi:hypothetical protein
MTGSFSNGDLTEDFCTHNENIERFLTLAEQERARQGQ